VRLTALRYRRTMYRLGLLLTVALPLAAADLAVKARVPTEPWAFHERSFPWLVLSLSLFAVLVAATRIPSILVAAAAGVLAGGLLGNGLSAAWNDMRVPNPLLLSAPHSVVAFNLADLWVVGGILLLVLALGSWLIANRELLPPPAEVRSTRGRAFRRLFQRS
jgi:hypothetical protein